MTKTACCILVLLFTAAGVVVGVSIHRDDPIRILAQARGQARGESAELLLKKCRDGDLGREESRRVCEILRPRLRNMADRLRRRESTLDMFAKELALAWELVAQKRISPEQSVEFLEYLDSPWCAFVPRAPIRFELHGSLIAPRVGTVVHHVVRVTSVDDHRVDVKVLETYLCANSPSSAGINWGAEERVDLGSQPTRSIVVEKRTVYYVVPPGVVRHLPVRTCKDAEFAPFEEVLRGEAAQEVCAYAKTLILTKTDGWQKHF